jgi:hypothetical protein
MKSFKFQNNISRRGAKAQSLKTKIHNIFILMFFSAPLRPCGRIKNGPMGSTIIENSAWYFIKNKIKEVLANVLQ